jgi:hypothetical protein
MRLETAGYHGSDVDHEVRANIAAVNLAPAVREALRLEMTGDEVRRWRLPSVPVTELE